MNSNIKDLILSECYEDNALAVEILKRSWLYKWRWKYIIRRMVDGIAYDRDTHLYLKLVNNYIKFTNIHFDSYNTSIAWILNQL